jgi:formiminotetrahydrofolate cyclodeaminase
MLLMVDNPGPTFNGLASLADERLGDVVEAMAGRQPLPAAGAAIAVTLALSAALLEKGASAPRDGVPIDSAAQGRAEHLRAAALMLADEDAAAYRRVLAARGNSERTESALSYAADPPLKMAETGVKLARLAEQILDQVPLSLQGEVRTAGHLACAGATAAAELVKIDLEALQDHRSGRASELTAEVAALASALTSRELRG